MESFEPFYNRVLIEPIDENKTASGIFVPDGEIRKHFGLVVAVGPGSVDADGKRRPMAAQVGERVYYAPMTGTPIKVNGKSFTVVSDEAILGVVRG